MTQVNFYGFNQRSQSLHFRKGQYDPNTQSVPDESFLNGDARPVQDGRYYKGDGVDSEIRFNKTDIIKNNKVSFGGWVKIGDNSKTNALCGFQSIVLYLGFFDSDADGNYELFIYGKNDGLADSVYSKSLYPDGQWHHIAGVKNGIGANNLKLYVDGKEVNTTTRNNEGSDLSKESTKRFYVLSRRSSDWNFNGIVKDVFVTGEALTESEINSIKNYDYDLTKLFGFFPCEEGNGNKTFDISGNGYHGTINNANLSTLHASGDDAPYSFQNNVGYTYDSLNNRYIPRDESDTDKDVQGNNLEYKGKVPYNVYAKDSNCGYVDNLGEELQFVNTVPSGSTLTYSGTAGLSLDVGNNKITVSSAGTLYDVVVTDGNGDRWSRLVASEGNNDLLYDVIANSSNNANIVNASLSTFWGQTQNSFHWNIEGFDLWADGSGNKLYVPFDENGNIIKTQGDTVSGFSWDSKHEPSTNFHNGAETRFDTDAEDPHFGDFKRAVSDTGLHPSNSVSGDDRYYIRKLPDDEADRFTLYLNNQVDPQKLKTQLFTQ